MQILTLRQLFDAVMDRTLKMSRTPANYWGEFALDIPIGIFLILEGFRRLDAHPAAILCTILAGLFFFSFFEYFFHRWVFHGSIRLIVEGHRAHHENPMGYDGIPFFMPALLLTGMIGLFVLIMPVSYALLLAAAVDFGYVTYGLSHFFIHHIRFRHRRIQRWASNHLIHHAHPDTNFGVTTPLWDIVLKTRFVRR